MTAQRVETIAPGITLYLGDCRDVMPSLGPVDAVVTDPPFGMAYQSARRSDRHEKINGDAGDDLLIWAASLAPRHSGYVFCRWNNLSAVPPPKSVITWVKNNWTSGDLEHEHARQTEQILFYAGPEHSWPRSRPADVIECPKVSSDDHPTEKPRQLMERIVEWTSGTVVDPFMGAGATGAACARLQRKFIGIEIDPKYFDLACSRIDEAARSPDMFHEPWGDMWRKPYVGPVSSGIEE